MSTKAAEADHLESQMYGHMIRTMTQHCEVRRAKVHSVYAELSCFGDLPQRVLTVIVTDSSRSVTCIRCIKRMKNRHVR